jgi:hypothetical protein
MVNGKLRLFLRQDRFQRDYQWRKIFVYCIPHFFQIHLEVSMNEAISNPYDLPPGDLSASCFRLFREPLRSFTDGFEGFQDDKLMHATCSKLFICQTFNEDDRVASRYQHSQQKSVISLH